MRYSAGISRVGTTKAVVSSWVFIRCCWTKPVSSWPPILTNHRAGTGCEPALRFVSYLTASYLTVAKSGGTGQNVAEMANPREYVQNIYQEIEQSCRSRLGKDSVNMLNTVSESVFSRSAHFILELLQNAEDAGPKVGQPNGEIEFAASDQRIRVTHNGLPFTECNVDAICGVRSTKKPEEGTLGFLGIGFKSVFKVTDCPQIHSGEFHFKFDRSAHDCPEDVPWQIMPIWVDAPNEAIDSALTNFVLPFRNGDFCKQTQDELRKLDVHVFLFLKWLRRVKIADESRGEETIIENLAERDGFVSVKKNDCVRRFVICRRSAQVPREVARDPALAFYKRQNVTKREVVVAFPVDQDGNLQSLDDASALGSVSSFLPLLEERTGAKFLIQADFLVQPGREAIQYELAWNHWLVGEAVEAAKEAIELFKAHPSWKRQFLPLFNFKSYDGQPAFDKLFGPKLRIPLLNYLKSADVVATASGTHARADLVVFPEKGLRDLLTDADLPSLFAGRTDLRLADLTIDFESLPPDLKDKAREVDLGSVARNSKLLKNRIGDPEWFRKLYTAMAETRREFRRTQTQGKRGRIEWVENPIFVLAETNEIFLANQVHIRDIPAQVSALRAQYPEVDRLLQTCKLLHPHLGRDELTEFFKERTHVGVIDYDKICRTVFLPKMRTTAPAPSKNELIAYTRLLQKGPELTEPIWLLTKQGNAKPSNQVFMGPAYSPAEDWEHHAQYSPQIDFLSPEYLAGVPSADVPGWKKFFLRAGVKESGENSHVEIFAMAFVEDKLSMELSNFVPKNRQQVGYDREARRNKDAALVKLEIKGRKKEEPVQLIGNEPRAARAALNNGEAFWVCVVPGIPESPQLWVVEDALKAGTSDTLKIDVTQWRTHGRRVP
jgi:hypothetical protein